MKPRLTANRPDAIILASYETEIHFFSDAKLQIKYQITKKRSEKSKSYETATIF